MTINTTTNRVSYTGNGVTTAFSFPYYFLADADLVVIKRTIADGTETTLVLTTDYTVSGAGVGAGGTVTTLTAYSSSYQIIIYRDPSQIQDVDLVENDPLPVETGVERPLDKLTMIAQRLKDRLDRAFRLSDGDTSGGTTSIAPVASYLLGFDASKNLTTVNPDTVATVSANQNWVVDTFSGTGAQTVFTLSADPGSINALIVRISGVMQAPTTNYALSGTTLTFTSAPASGTGNVIVQYGVTITNMTTPADGTVTTAKIIDSAVTTAKINDSAVTTAKINAAAVTASKLDASAISGCLVNGYISASVSGNALTAAVKTLAGSDPSSSDPVMVLFRNATAGTGSVSVLSLTAATSVVVSSGSTLGTSSAVPSRVWIVGFNDAGTFRLGVINCASSSQVFPLADDVLASSTAEGGAGAADSAGTIYTGTAVSSKPLRVLAYVESTQATAGTWATSPSKVQPWTMGTKLPGDIVQIAFSQTGAVATGTTTIPADDTIPQNTEGTQFLTQAIAPTSAANYLLIEVRGSFAASTSSDAQKIMALFQDSTANALSAVSNFGSSLDNTPSLLFLKHAMLAGTNSSTTFKMRMGSASAGTMTFNGASSARLLGGVFNSYLRITEIMA